MFWSVEEFCDGFLKLIDHLELDKVRIVLTCAIMSHFATVLYVYMYMYMYMYVLHVCYHNRELPS